MDQHSGFYSAYQRSQNDPTAFAEPPADCMVPAAAQESDTGTFSYYNQSAANPYPYNERYQSHLTQGGSGYTEYGWSDTYSTQDNYTTDTLAVQAGGMELDYQPVQSEFFASSDPEFETPEIEPDIEWTSYDQPPAQTKKQFVCLQPNCKQKPFGRSADLDRHYKIVHKTAAPKPKFHCDYRHCPRAKEDAPFYRQDHFRDHFREYHKEDLVARGSKINKEWWKTRILLPHWWRCNKCLRRVYGDSDGWVCPNCRSTCDSERQRERTRRKLESA